MSITFYLREIYHEFLLVMYMFLVEEKHNNSENDQLICCILKQQAGRILPYFRTTIDCYYLCKCSISYVLSSELWIDEMLIC